jgi:hypothetical protein
LNEASGVSIDYVDPAGMSIIGWVVRAYFGTVFSIIGIEDAIIRCTFDPL